MQPVLYSVLVMTLAACGGGAVSPSDTASPASAAVFSAVSPEDIRANSEVLLTIKGANLPENALVTGSLIKCDPPQSRTPQSLQLKCTTGAAGKQELSVWVQAQGKVAQRVGGLSLTVSDRASTRRLVPTGAGGSTCFATGATEWVACDSEAAISLNPLQDGMQKSSLPSFSKVLHPATGTAFALEDCVKDARTDLVWEGKTSLGWRAGYRLFTHYVVDLDDPIDQAMTAGYVDSYLSQVNQVALCGFSDWRLPSPEELQGLVNYGAAGYEGLLPPDWFTNSNFQARYWSSIPYADSRLLHWYVDFATGAMSIASRQEGLSLRLVRGPDSAK